VTVRYSGSIELTNRSLNGTFVSRELRHRRLHYHLQLPPRNIPISGSYCQFSFLDGVAFAVHHDNPIGSLDFRQLDAALSTTRWRGGSTVTKRGQLGVESDLEYKEDESMISSRGMALKSLCTSR
jgi:phosphate transport system substrate-binding protein